MRFQVLLSLLSVTSWLCIDKIPEVAKTKVSKPKRYSLSMFLYNSLSKTLPRPPKTAHSNTPPHKYLLLTVQMQSFACRVCVCVCVCVWECARVWEREMGSQRSVVCVCVCVHVCEKRETRSHHNRGFITVSVTWLCSPLGLELMVKLRTLLTVFTFILKAKARKLWRGALHFRRGLWCSASHNALCQLANQSRLCLSEGGTL